MLSAVTTLTLLGDGSGNYVSTEQVGAAFPNLGSIVYSLQGGQNLVFASTKRDVVVGTNTGQDVIYLPAEGAADDLLTLSTGTDTVNVEGRPATTRSTWPTGAPVRPSSPEGPGPATLTGTEFLGIAADTGDDTIDAVDLSGANLTSLTVQAGPGDDSIEGGDLPNVLGGGTGANSLVGGPVGDTINSTSASDVIEARGGLDTVNDQGSGRVGDRFIIGPPSEADNSILRVDGDVAIRSRAGDAADSATVVAALGRTGLQELGPNTYQVSYQPDSVGAPDDRALFDVAALPGHPQRITSASANTVVDLVVPTGSWTRTGGIVSFTGPYEDVIVPGLGTVNIRSPFTDPEERFAHRLLPRPRDAHPVDRRALGVPSPAGVRRHDPPSWCRCCRRPTSSAASPSTGPSSTSCAGPPTRRAGPTGSTDSAAGSSPGGCGPTSTAPTSTSRPRATPMSRSTCAPRTATSSDATPRSPAWGTGSASSRVAPPGAPSPTAS